MRNDTVGRVTCAALLALVVLAGVISQPAWAAPPVVKTVRVLASSPTIPHDACQGVATRLKGTSDQTGTFTWDFGDGAPAATGAVTDPYSIEVSHTYTGAVGTLYTATLTVKNASNETGSAQYRILIEPCVLATRVNIAIDEGLWYLHKTMTRTTASGVPVGHWASGSAGSGYYAVSALNVNAFEVNGFLQTGPADDPYTETASRGLNKLFQYLVAQAISNQTNGLGTFNPDTNGNGIGVSVGQYPDLYQGGGFIDAIVGSGTPNAVAQLGGGNVVGRLYKDIVQDMVDWYSYCQYDSSGGGGWRYSCQQFPDNSACQWAAIGNIPALRQWGLIVPQIVKNWNVKWLEYSQASNGVFGYTSTGPIWGPYATTPSGMVQMAMDGIGRGTPMWDKTETYMRTNFPNGGGASNAVKDYYYGLFSFTKSMLLHDMNGDNVAEPLKLLKSTIAGVLPLRWYDAESGVDQGVSEAEPGIPAGMPLGPAPTHGVARTLVDDQTSSGYWWGHNYTNDQYPMETGMAIIMLRRTVVEIPPVAKIDAVPNPVLAGMPVNFSGAASYHPNPSRIVDSWEWDLDNNGSFETTGVNVSRSFGAPGNYPVTLRVTDNGTPEASDTETITIVVKQPPVAPTADAGGPYNFCPNRQPWFLNGLGSVNPDEGVSEPGMPPNTILEYAWDLDGDNDFNDAFGASPNVTALLTSVGNYLIQLRVTDNSAISHPVLSNKTNLSDTDTATLNVRGPTDPQCACVGNLAARPKPGKADLTWTWQAGVHHYNVYRGTVSGGPYLKIATVNNPGLPNTGVYADSGLTNGVTYYYVVRAAAINNDELCQSNEASARPVAR